MDFLRSIIKGLLLEEANKDSVIDAVKKHYKVDINYNDSEDKANSGSRTIYPVCYGVSTAGNPVVRAYQEQGFSKTFPRGWKEFRLDSIVGWKPRSEEIFSEPQGFNKYGDKGMSQVFVISNFDSDVHQQVSDHFKGLRQNIANAKNGNDIDYVRKNVEDWRRRNGQRPQQQASKPTKGNNTSIDDMSKVQNFGDGNDTQTVGPIRKGRENSLPQQNSNVDYGKAMQNGPVYQNSDKEEIFKTDSEKNPTKYDTLKQNIENSEDGYKIDYIRKNIEDWQRKKNEREQRKLDNNEQQ